VNGILDEVNALGFAEIVVISGGNPLLWDLTELVKKLQEKYEVHVETQGSVWKDWLLKVDHVTLSPKPPSSGIEANFSRFEQILRKLRMEGAFYQKVDVKVVVFDSKDLEYAIALAEAGGLQHLHLSVGTVMDEPLEATLDRFRTLIPLVNEYKDRQFTVSLQPQMHVILWGHSLGV
jgi:7-carboxy-7-deazaguanine synthase